MLVYHYCSNIILWETNKRHSYYIDITQNYKIWSKQNYGSRLIRLVQVRVDK